MKIVQKPKIEKESVKIGDVIHLRGISENNNGDEMFLQAIEVFGVIRLLNIERGWCVNDSFNLGYRNVEQLLGLLREEWIAWEIINTYDGAECGVSLPSN